MDVTQVSGFLCNPCHRLPGYASSHTFALAHKDNLKAR